MEPRHRLDPVFKRASVTHLIVVIAVMERLVCVYDCVCVWASPAAAARAWIRSDVISSVPAVSSRWTFPVLCLGRQEAEQKQEVRPLQFCPTVAQ